MASSSRVGTVVGAVFVVTFVASLALLGDEAGAFGDSDRAFVEHFSTSSQRSADILGAFLLIVAAAAFMTFTHVTSSIGGDGSRPYAPVVVRTAGMVAGMFMILAALALMTVPLSIAMGDFFDEGGGGAFVVGRAVLPQFGYVVLVFGAMIPAAVTIVAVTQLRAFPTWLTWVSYSVAILLALTSTMVVSMILLPIWVAIATPRLRRTVGGRTIYTEA